ncbi:MAG: M6 family metalloprotease domain-containing protein [Rikenellaceae bacterium]
MTHTTKKWQQIVASVMILLTATLFAPTLYGVPAKPGVITVDQVDGTQLNIKIYGDEYFSWRTTESGYTIAQKEDGYYYYVDYNADGTIVSLNSRVLVDGRVQTPPSSLSPSSSKMDAIAERAMLQQRNAKWNNNSTISRSSETKYSAAFPSIGTIKSAVILVEYSDLEFSIDDPNTAFTNQLNQEGYSVSGATGSAKDFFTANSRGQFDGQFDVYGPYKLSQSRSYYGGNSGSSGNDLRPDDMIEEAVELAYADGVDFSQYDFDEDGYIDNIFVYYAGHNEAEGGPSDSVWPHKWVVSSQPSFNGKRLFVYACTSELRGSSGSTIAGIGTFCHEFSHVFGLADHYDTNGATNGTCQGLGVYDLMTSGSYNNSGNTPPMMTGLELDMIGWNTPVTIETNQNITQETINKGEVYKIETETTDEYFLLETRNKSSIVWENYIDGDGLFITHVDRSSQYIYLWNQNGPNTNTSHECYRYIVAGNTSLNGNNWYKVPYPYLTNNSWTSTSSPAALSWGNKELDINIIDIKINDDGSTSYICINSKDGSINVMLDYDQKQIYTAVPFYITYSLYPEQEDGSVTWSSSDDSIATIDTNGCALFSKAGTATFTATCNQNSEYSNFITLSAIDLQGVKGRIQTNDSQSLSGAALTFYPATRIVEQTASEQIISFTRTEGAKSIEATSDEYGNYLAELDKGYYEVEIQCTQHNELFDVIYIEDGTNEVNFSLDNYSEVVSDLAVEIGQSDVTLTWNAQSYTSFKVLLTNESGTSKTISVDESRCIIEGLNTDSSYTATISALTSNSSYKELYSTEFTTLCKYTTIPMIHLEEYEYNDGEVLELKIINASSTDVTTWIFDNVELPSNKVILNQGEHTIQAQVVRGSSTYRANKVINVK